MTNPTPHGQVPEALRLAEQYDHGDPAAHGNAWKAAVCTELRRLAELEAQIEALSGVQALSAAPAVDITTAGEMQAFEAWYKQDCVIEGAAAKMAAKAAWKARAMLAATPTPPAEQQAAQVIIDFSQVGTAGPFPVANGRVSLPDATMQDLARMLRPTYEAEQQAQTDAVYAELPEKYYLAGGEVPTWDAKQMHAFADRTHALRQAVIAPELQAEARRCYDAAMEQAAPEAAPVEQDDHQILAITTAYEQGVGKGHQAYNSGKEIANPYSPAYRCDLAWQYGYKEGKEQAQREAKAAPRQEAQEPYAYAVYFPDQPKVELVHDLDELIDDLTNQTHVVTKLYTAPQPAPDCHHRPPCDECAAIAAQGGKT